LAIGFVTAFFDTLGISSFATTTSLFKFAKAVPDRVIPGTLNVGHLLPTVVQAFIYVRACRSGHDNTCVADHGISGGCVAGCRRCFRLVET